MAGSNQYSRGLKFIVASLVLLFFLAITVESRAVSFTAPLLPYYGGKATSANKKFVGNAIAYIALKGKNAFSLTMIAMINENPKNIVRASVFETSKPKTTYANLTFDSSSGFYTFNQRISFEVGQAIHEQKASVGFYYKNGKSEKLAISGPLSNNRTTFVSYLTSNAEIDSPKGVSKSDGYASIHAYANAAGDAYYLTATVNHDLTDKVTAIHLHGPAPSGAAGDILLTFDHSKNKAGTIFNTVINSTVFYWCQNSLCYINIHTSKNPNGAIRGQVIPLTAPRTKLPFIPSGATHKDGTTTITYLSDGSTIIGDLTALGAGGARPTNKTIGMFDHRVAYFFANNASSFSDYFQFRLPVSRVNRFNTRGALVVITATCEVVDANKWIFNLYDQATGKDVNPGFDVPALGNRTYSTASADLGPDSLPEYLGPGGIYLKLTGTSVTDPLYVDRLYTVFYVASAYSNNIVRSIFIAGSKAFSSR